MSPLCDVWRGCSFPGVPVEQHRHKHGDCDAGTRGDRRYCIRNSVVSCDSNIHRYVMMSPILIEEYMNTIIKMLSCCFLLLEKECSVHMFVFN